MIILLVWAHRYDWKNHSIFWDAWFSGIIAGGFWYLNKTERREWNHLPVHLELSNNPVFSHTEAVASSNGLKID